MKNVCSKLYIALALCLCLLPSLGILAFGESGAAANERLTARPALQDPSGKANLQVLNDCADYLADHFALRQEMVTLWSSLQAKLLHSSSEEQVILGREGWLYYAPTLPDYTGQALPEEALEAIARRLAALQAEAEGRGAVFLFTVAPNKNSLYPDHMPGAFPAAHDRGNLARLLPYLERYGVNYLDLSALPLPYYRTDTHWTAEGAAMAADAMLAALGRESGYAAGPFGEGGPRPGDLYEMLYPAGLGEEAEVLYLGALDYTCEGDPNGGNAITIRTRGSGEGRLFCWRDSFGIALYPYLADAFAETLFSRSTDYALPGEDYDVIILELAERNLPNLYIEQEETPHA